MDGRLRTEHRDESQSLTAALLVCSPARPGRAHLSSLCNIPITHIAGIECQGNARSILIWVASLFQKTNARRHLGEHHQLVFLPRIYPLIPRRPP
ncbi:hypothetical protein VTH06DRAFT_2199 [Thermothelomyces fergusii]